MRYIVLCGAVLFAFTASAQSVDFGVHGNFLNLNIPAEITEFAGVTTPTNVEALALKEVYGIGYGGGIHLIIGTPILSIRISGDYSTLTPNNDKFKSYLRTIIGPLAENASVEGGRITVIAGDANLKFTFLPLPVVKPYLTGGIGLGNVKADDVKITLGNQTFSDALLKNQTVMTLNGGVGVDLAFGGVAVYGEVRVVAFFLEPKTATYLPIGTVGITF